jgi:hypothetical protein
MLNTINKGNKGYSTLRSLCLTLAPGVVVTVSEELTVVLSGGVDHRASEVSLTAASLPACLNEPLVEHRHPHTIQWTTSYYFNNFVFAGKSSFL